MLLWCEYAEELGATLSEALTRATSNDFVVWKAYRQVRQNTPDRTDHYLMQISAAIKQFAASLSASFAGGKPKEIRLSDQKIPFVPEGEGDEGSEVTGSEQDQDSKPAVPSAWQLEKDLIDSKANVARALGLPELLHGGGS